MTINWLLVAKENTLNTLQEELQQCLDQVTKINIVTEEEYLTLRHLQLPMWSILMEGRGAQTDSNTLNKWMEDRGSQVSMKYYWYGCIPKTRG